MDGDGIQVVETQDVERASATRRRPTAGGAAVLPLKERSPTPTR